MEKEIAKTNLKKVFIISLVAIILLMAAVTGIYYYKKTQEAQLVELEKKKAESALKIGDFPAAVERYEKVLENLKSEDPELLRKYAIALVGSGERDKAEEVYKKLIEIEPKNAQNYFDLAILYYDKRETTQAIEYAKKAASMAAAFIPPRYFLARQFFAESKYGDALQYYLEILKIDSKIPLNSPDIYKEIAYCYKNLKQKEQAIFYLQQYLSLNPGDSEARKELDNLKTK